MFKIDPHVIPMRELGTLAGTGANFGDERRQMIVVLKKGSNGGDSCDPRANTSGCLLKGEMPPIASTGIGYGTGKIQQDARKHGVPKATFDVVS